MALAALGVVYGDIGTSPLYALRECFHASHGLSVTLPTIAGLLSLIIWALLLVVTVKYLLFVMRADNQGEGGTLSLMALGQRHREESAFPLRIGPVIALGLLGASLVYSDGIITPAISVLSAVEGIEVETTAYQPYTLPIAIAVLLGSLQSSHMALGGSADGLVLSCCFGLSPSQFWQSRALSRPPRCLPRSTPTMPSSFFWTIPRRVLRC
jgi:KUP system potassium uptake protein